MAWSFLGSNGRPEQNKSQQRRERKLRKTRGRRPLFEELEARHLLAVFTVTNLSDGAVAPVGSLRDAINHANAAAGADTIQFTSGLTGTIPMAALSGDMDITGPLTINGPGAANLSIDATAAVARIFNIDPASGDVMIKGLTLTKGVAGAGNSGGAIYSGSLGMLTISDSVITGNTAGGNGGGIFTAGDLIVTNTTIGGATAGLGNTASADGGGIYAQGTVMLKNSIISGNEATLSDGGGVYAIGSITVQNSTIGGLTAPEANVAGNRGGGVYTTSLTLQSSTVAGNTANATGGGIKATTIVVTNSTVSGNTATTGAGGGINGFNVVVRDSTVANNTAVASTGGGIKANIVTLQDATVAGNDATAGTGGGLDVSTKLNIQDSIVAANTAGTANPDLRIPATLTDTKLRSSLIGDKTNTALTATGAATQDVNGNFIGDGAALAITTANAFGTGGGTLGNNGGPTQTIALLAGSIAIDKGNNGLAVNANQGDQRGLPFVRISPFGGTVDMGAFEVQTATAGNNAPVVANPISAKSAVVDNLFAFTFPTNTFTDADGDTLSYTATLAGGGALPGWLTFNATSRTFSGTPSAGDVGAITVRLTASDGKGGTAFTDFALSVVTNPPPVLSNAIPDTNATVAVPFNFTFAANSFTDPNGDPLTYTAALTGGGSLPSWLTFTSATRTFSGTPGVGDVGTISVRVTASDGHGGIASDDFNITTSTSELPFTENFDGTVDARIKEKSPSFATTTSSPISGTASYVATRPTEGSRPVATVDFTSPTTPPAISNVSVNVSTLPGNGHSVWSNAVIVFDYVSPTNYKFAGVFEIIDKLIIGQVVNGKVTYLAQCAFPAAPNTTIPLNLGINHGNGQVTLTSGGTSFSYTYASLGTGTVGIGTINANAKFDNLNVS